MLMAQPLPANVSRPLNAAVNTTIPKAVNATQAQLASGNALGAGQAVGSNLNKNLGAANAAVNNYTKAANQIATANSNIPNMAGNATRKNRLNMSEKHFRAAALESASNRPVNAAKRARQGINALRNYLGGNQ
jgi:hypothetical protein